MVPDHLRGIMRAGYWENKVNHILKIRFHLHSNIIFRKFYLHPSCVYFECIYVIYVLWVFYLKYFYDRFVTPRNSSWRKSKISVQSTPPSFPSKNKKSIQNQWYKWFWLIELYLQNSSQVLNTKWPFKCIQVKSTCHYNKIIFTSAALFIFIIVFFTLKANVEKIPSLFESSLLPVSLLQSERAPFFVFYRSYWTRLSEEGLW